MYRFAARPAQSPTPLDLPCRLSDPRSNQRPLYNHTTPEPLEDQCWWREQTSGQSASARAHASKSVPSLRPTGANSRQLGSIVREFQRLLRCSAAKRVFPSSCPLSLSTEAHRPSADLPSAVAAPCLADKVDTLPVGRQELCSSRLPPPGKGLGLLVWVFDCTRLVVSTDDSIATSPFAENLKSWLL